MKDQLKYAYRPVDKEGQTIDFLLTGKQDAKTTLRFLKKPFGQHGTPSLLTID
ncbi:MAG: IS6 family transposase [Nitrospirales bacterium]|nr:IS6 family transposase [Nitrospirales bacterium]